MLSSASTTSSSGARVSISAVAPARRSDLSRRRAQKRLKQHSVVVSVEHRVDPILPPRLLQTTCAEDGTFGIRAVVGVHNPMSSARELGESRRLARLVWPCASREEPLLRRVKRAPELGVPERCSNSRSRASVPPRLATERACLQALSRWAVPGSNQRPPACKAGALPTELTAREPQGISPRRRVPRAFTATTPCAWSSSGARARSRLPATTPSCRRRRSP
jgi:hypothetical protein